MPNFPEINPNVTRVNSVRDDVKGDLNIAL